MCRNVQHINSDLSGPLSAKLSQHHRVISLTRMFKMPPAHIQHFFSARKDSQKAFFLLFNYINLTDDCYCSLYRSVRWVA